MENTPADLPSAIEALLFVSPEPVQPSDLATVLGISLSSLESFLVKLENQLRTRGLRLQQHGGRVQLTTAPEYASLVEEFLGLETTTHLSRAALETLAIVAYRQPVTRPFIEGIRGVSCDGVMKSLLGKGLIQEDGRAEGPGRPILYRTTSDFLNYFGLGSLSELPPLDLSDIPGSTNHDDMLKN